MLKRLSRPFRAFSSRSFVQSYRNQHQQQQRQQLINSIGESVRQNEIQSSKNIFQMISIIGVSVLGTIGIYTVYQVVYRKDRVFIPIWLSLSRKSLLPSDIDTKQIQDIAEDQLLERLTLNETIQADFKLPLIQEKSTEFEVWIELKNPILKGLEITPNNPFFNLISKPLKLDDVFDKIREPVDGLLGKDAEFKINVYNEELVKKNDFDIVFLGTATIRGIKSGKVGEIVYRGAYLHEHLKEARIEKAHLILTDGKGNKTREILW